MQVVHLIKDNEKSNLLERELERADFEERQKRVIVFANTKRQCETVSKHLTNLDYRYLPHRNPPPPPPPHPEDWAYSSS